MRLAYNNGILISVICFFLTSGTGLSTVLTNPYQIMHGYYQAIGGLERLKKITSSYSEGRIHQDGLQGKFRHWDARPLQFRTEQDYSIISQVEGDSGEFPWLLDTNGQLLIHRDSDTRQRRRISQLFDHYEHLNPDSPYLSLFFAGITVADGHRCYEVVLSSTVNSDTSHFFFDTTSLLLRQLIQHQPDSTIISSYDDYRDVHGLLLPFHQRTKWLPWEKVEETWTTSYLVNVKIDESLFFPEKQQKDYFFPGGHSSVTIPFRFSENLIYLAVTIGQDTRYWILDSGASMSVVDAEYARKLGLDIQGKIKGYGFGDHFPLSFVNVPYYRVGGIVFRNRKFFVSEGLTKKSYEPEIFGILGYDFLSRFVVEIDYDLQRATFHLPESFTYAGGGTTIDAPLKYRTFSLPVTLDHRFTSLWSLDLGSYRSSIHYPFAKKHGLLTKSGVESVSQGMAGISYEVNAQFDCLAIERFEIDRPLISIPSDRGTGVTALGEVGGNLGNSTLRHFHLYLNYPAQQVIIEKGAHYNQHFPRDKSGMLVGRADNNRPMISFVAENSPAAQAGLYAGDIITEVNGKQVTTSHPIPTLRQMLRGAAGQKILLKVSRRNQPVTTTLILRQLYPSKENSCIPGRTIE